MMAHSRINQDRMFDWIERRIVAGEPLPSDEAICSTFGFESPESARTLLADLADAGRITIKGWGETRSISLGRQRHGAPATPRPIRTVTKADPDVEAGTARIMEILRRPKADTIAKNADALIATVAQPAPQKGAPTPKEKTVGTKTIMLPATAVTAIRAVEDKARIDSISQGQAAATLIDLGASAGEPQPSAPTAASLEDAPLDALIGELRRRLDQNGTAALARAEAAEAEVEALNAKLAQIRSAIA